MSGILIALATWAARIWASVVILVIAGIATGAGIDAVRERRKRRADVAYARQLGRDWEAWEKQLRRRSRGYARGRV